MGFLYENENGAPQLTFAGIGEATAVYEYSVLVTSLDGETETLVGSIAARPSRRGHAMPGKRRSASPVLTPGPTGCSRPIQKRNDQLPISG